MDDIIDTESFREPISIARCRELLGDEALEWSDEDVDAIRQHAHAMAHVLVEIFLGNQPRE
ncbi:MAG: hypothetical protein ABR606_20230 [Vicinamibacterales bacterium]